MKRNLRYFLLLLFSFALVLTLSGCFSSTKDTSPKTASITGKVIFPEGTAYLLFNQLFVPKNVENPGLSTTVVYLDDTKYAVTTVDGAFAFYNVPTGKHKLRVSDAYYESEEYPVDVTANGITSINLTANFNGIGLLVSREPNSSIEAEMLVACEYPKMRLAPSSTVKVEYSTGGAYTLIASYPYTVEREIDISDLPLDTEYTFKVSIIDDETGTIKNFFTKKMTLPDFNSVAPTTTSINEGQPTFTWTQIPGPASYNLKINGPESYRVRVYGLTTSSYQIPIDNQITNFGDGYSWTIDGFGFDLAGHPSVYARVEVGA